MQMLYLFGQESQFLKLLKGETEKYLTLEDHLEESVIGQNDAVKSIADAIRKNKSGLSDTNKPLGTFQFLGPTGVGKTELCKTLAVFFLMMRSP